MAERVLAGTRAEPTQHRAERAATPPSATWTPSAPGDGSFEVLDARAKLGHRLADVPVFRSGGAAVQAKRALPAPGLLRLADREAVEGPRAKPARSSPGRPLPASVRRAMEASLGADFAGVRVHEGPEPAALGAVAFARGDDLHFGPGRYDPDTSRGRELLGHELTHVVQQRAGRVATASAGVDTSPALEAEADTLGARAARGQPGSPPSPAAGIQLKKSLSSGAAARLVKYSKGKSYYTLYPVGGMHVTVFIDAASVVLLEKTIKARGNLARAVEFLYTDGQTLTYDEFHVTDEAAEDADSSHFFFSDDGKPLMSGPGRFSAGEGDPGYEKAMKVAAAFVSSHPSAPSEKKKAPVKPSPSSVVDDEEVDMFAPHPSSSSSASEPSTPSTNPLATALPSVPSGPPHPLSLYSSLSPPTLGGTPSSLLPSTNAPPPSVPSGPPSLSSLYSGLPLPTPSGPPSSLLPSTPALPSSVPSGPPSLSSLYSNLPPPTLGGTSSSLLPSTNVLPPSIPSGPSPLSLYSGLPLPTLGGTSSSLLPSPSLGGTPSSLPPSSSVPLPTASTPSRVTGPRLSLSSGFLPRALQPRTPARPSAPPPPQTQSVTQADPSSGSTIKKQRTDQTDG